MWAIGNAMFNWVYCEKQYCVKYDSKKLKDYVQGLNPKNEIERLSYLGCFIKCTDIVIKVILKICMMINATFNVKLYVYLHGKAHLRALKYSDFIFKEFICNTVNVNFWWNILPNNSLKDKNRSKNKVLHDYTVHSRC